MQPDPLMEARVTALEREAANFKLHNHNKYNSNAIKEDDIILQTIRRWHVLPGTSPATSSNFGVFFIADGPCVVTTFWEVHKTAGTDGSAVTLQLEKLTGTTAPGSGTTLLTSAISLRATANTVQKGTIVGTATSRTLASGDRLALKLSGTPTSLADVCILLEVQLI